MSNRDSIKSVLNDVCELVRQNARGKNRTITVSPEVAERLNRIQSAPVRKPNSPANSVSPKASGPATAFVHGPIPPGIQDLETLERYMMDCHACPLGALRSRLVFGAGNPKAGLVFVGEAPGAEEDRQGKPFVGRAGQLLTDIIEKGMRIQRSEVYICNVLKCRPPDNRNPLPNEVEQCEPFLIRQLEIIRPKVICTLGAYATQTLLKTLDPIGRLRGRWHFYHGIPLRATYHPAYLLRNPSDKRKTWEDVLEVLKVYRGEFTPGP